MHPLLDLAQARVDARQAEYDRLAQQVVDLKRKVERGEELSEVDVLAINAWMASHFALEEALEDLLIAREMVFGNEC